MREGQKTHLARRLRREMTDVERALWHHLRNRAFMGRKFRRQCPIGPYIADFVCIEAGLVVEVDGGQYAGSGYDAARDAHLTQRGFRVLRFWNNEVLDNLEGVCDMILRHLCDSDVRPGPDPDLPPQAGEGDAR